MKIKPVRVKGEIPLKEVLRVVPQRTFENVTMGDANFWNVEKTQENIFS